MGGCLSLALRAVRRRGGGEDGDGSPDRRQESLSAWADVLGGEISDYSCAPCTAGTRGPVGGRPVCASLRARARVRERVRPHAGPAAPARPSPRPQYAALLARECAGDGVAGGYARVQGCQSAPGGRFRRREQGRGGAWVTPPPLCLSSSLPPPPRPPPALSLSLSLSLFLSLSLSGFLPLSPSLSLSL